MLSIKPFKVNPRKTVPATSALLTTISVCANAKTKKRITASILTITGMFSITCEIDTVERIVTMATVKKVSGSSNRLIRKIILTFFITLLVMTVIFLNGILPLILVRYIFTYLSHFIACTMHPGLNSTLTNLLNFSYFFIILMLNNI